MDLAIEDTIKLHVWMNNAPTLFQNDIDWIVQETRASEHTFEESEGKGEILSKLTAVRYGIPFNDIRTRD